LSLFSGIFGETRPDNYFVIFRWDGRVLSLFLSLFSGIFG